MIFDIPVGDLTAPGLIGLGVLLIMTGRLVPVRFYKNKSDESERWRLSFETERETRKVLDKQTSELLESQKATHAVILAILKNSEEIQREVKRGDRDVAS